MDKVGGSLSIRKWIESSYIFEIQQTGIANVLDVRNVGRREFKDNYLDFDLSNWVKVMPCTAMGAGNGTDL